MTTLKVGIASYQDMKARSMAIARGEGKARRGEPKVWFTSLESFAKVLSDRNRALLKLIAEQEPESLTELAKSSGRAKSNLSRTLRTLERYGLVHLEKGYKGRVAPRVPYSDIVLDVPIGTSAKRGNTSSVSA
ncbi:MAG: helix-turn-helix domain-containing protein [Alphaproteobacteria bacterium]|jgi:predicted transcriptional regulator|nr:helix-turn-helix domain-containing protein [Alphaproteobacteria bacterium]MDP6269452.1 helix-turn-helix domain-containing protein [Alphaproteobacteria bacterium]MDP7163930.1 helix-turn-helix domain-containing protein [Alphaproteobacteria bacterium]